MRIDFSSSDIGLDSILKQSTLVVYEREVLASNFRSESHYVIKVDITDGNLNHSTKLEFVPNPQKRFEFDTVEGGFEMEDTFEILPGVEDIEIDLVLIRD